jgi:hypothetical protein
MKNDWYISDNFCGYFWNVVFSGLIVLYFTAMVAICLFVLVVAPLLYLVVGLQYQFFEPPKEVAVGLVFDIGLLLVCVVFLFSDWLAERKQRKRDRDYEEFVTNNYKKVEKKPSFIATAWRTFKDKTCFRIEFED